MTKEEQRIAIAEAHGYQWSVPHFDHDGRWHVTPYKGRSFWTVERSAWAGEPHNIVKDIAALPDYLNDLNAMHKAIMSLSQEQRMHFNGVLMDRAQPGQRYHLDRAINAAAAQRAKVFLRALGKWRDAA